MTKIFRVRNIIIYLLVIIVVGGFFLWRHSAGKNEAEYITEKVSRGRLAQTVEATGKVESADRIKLNFRVAGRISQILVKVGEQARAGQILARLNAGGLQSKVADARAQIDKEKAAYDELIAGAAEEDIQVSQDTVEQKRKDLEAKQNALDNLLKKKETELQNLKETAITVVNNEVIVAKAAIQEIQDTLENSDAIYSLAIRKPSSLSKANYSKDQAEKEISQLFSEAGELAAFSSDEDEDVLACLENAKDALNSVKTALDDTFTVLDYTTVSNYLSESELDTLKDNIQSDQSSINTSRTNIQTAKSNWTNKIFYYQEQEASAEDDVAKAEAALKVAESQLALKISPPQLFQINVQKAKITQAEAALSLALANLGDAIIRAPIAGTITKKNFEAGEQTSLSEPVLEMIGKSNLEIEVDIPESDIAKLKTEQKAEITLDAFSEEERFGGTVTFVDPAETVIQEIVYYKVNVQFDEQYEGIKPGMTANVTIFTDSRENVVYIPLRAVKSDNGDDYVEILENGAPVKRVVELGLRGDSGVEALSGLKEGEEVITFVKEK